MTKPDAHVLPPWCRLSGTAIILTVAVQPAARKTELVGLHDGCLRIRVAAPPVEGAANKALVGFLAATLGVRKRDLHIVRGESGRRKQISLDGVPVKRVIEIISKMLQP